MAKIKITLIIKNKEIDITGELKNWDDIELTYKRKDFGGIYRTFAKKFEFIKGAYKALKQLYLSEGLVSSAKIVIYRQINDLTYKEAYRCSLDFMSYSDDGYTLTLSAIDDDTYSIINSQKSQVFDIAVSDMPQVKMTYKRMYLNNRVSWSVNPTDEQTETGVYPIEYFGNHEFPMVYNDVNFPVPGRLIQYDIGTYHEASESILPFVESLTDITVRLVLNFDITPLSAPDIVKDRYQ